MRTVVVLPAPFGPSRPSTVPVDISRSTPSNARVDPNVLTSASARTATSDAGEGMRASSFEVVISLSFGRVVRTDDINRANNTLGTRACGMIRRMVQPQPPSRSKRAILLTALAGLVVGAGGVGLAWALTGKSEATGTDADARAVCGILARTPDPVNFDQFGLPDAQRWAATADLATAIAAV